MLRTIGLILSRKFVTKPKNKTIGNKANRYRLEKISVTDFI